MKISSLLLLVLFVALTSCTKPSLRDTYSKSFDDLCKSDEDLNNLVRTGLCYTSENQHGGPCTATMLKTLTKAEADHWTAFNTAATAWSEFIQLDANTRYFKPDAIRPGQTAVPWLDETHHLHFALLPTDQAKTTLYTVSLVLDVQAP